MDVRDDRSVVPTVETKLLVPPTPRHLVARTRLLDSLDRGVADHLTLLAAPAGAGKTVLLASWVRRRKLPGPACWLTLDVDDNDASRLIADLLSALRTAGPAAQVSGIDRLIPPLGARTDRFLPLLINALAALPSPVVLILDEVHELSSPQAIATLDFLVRHAPKQCRIVLAGRADPQLPIERLRIGEELSELRVGDLAFNRRETGELCKQLELELSDPDIDLLWSRTEGWAAALRLAALSLQNHPDPARFLADFAGTDRAIADYLVAEVLARFSDERREFMLRTSLVDEVNAELADALTGSEGGALTLAALERSGAPVQPVSDGDSREDGPYRYHPLFRELLRAHLRHAHSQVALLHRRAATWYVEHGESMPAIRHALAGGDWEQAAGLITENWLWLFLRGSAAAMRGPMSDLPADIIAADPRLAAAFAGSRLQDGDMAAAERYLAIARETRDDVREEAREQLELTLTAVTLHRARLRERVRDAERLARKLTGLARGAPRARRNALRSFALSSVAATRVWSGDGAQARGELEEAFALATEDGHEHIMLDCLAQLAIVDLQSGELTAAHERSERAVALAERGGWGDGPAAACAYLACATVAYRRGEFERAEGLLTHACAAAEIAEQSVRVAIAVQQALTLAAAGPRSAAQGALKLRVAHSTISEAEAAAVPRFLRIALAEAQGRVLLAAGEPERARVALSQVQARMPGYARLLVRQAALELDAGEIEPARETLATALALEPPPSATAGEAGGIDVEIEAWLLRALVEHADGYERAAADALEQALTLAEREPYRDAFLLNGPILRALLESQAQLGTAHPALLEVLLDGVSTPRAQPGATLAEPLTERELRILHYLPTMLSNSEIGAEMFVSLNTVKTHLRSIYRKLDARGRADAVEKARRVGLLPSGIKRPRVLQRTSR